jgi:protein-arginine kinase activator protein McsA
MMNVRAAASLMVDKKQYTEALETVEEGLSSIKEFFVKFGQEEAYSHSNEVRVLKRFARDIRKKLPVDPLAKLQSQLDRAVKQERYEDAAKLRDEIRRKSEQQA